MRSLKQNIDAARARGDFELVKAIARESVLDYKLVFAIIEQESLWDPFAFRSESESGFMTRYGAAYQEIVKKTATILDDKWIRSEDLFYASFGYMQTMYCVIIETFPEATEELVYPTRLCDPAVGVRYGCRLLNRKMKSVNQDNRLALLRWNGGGDKQYPDKVFARLTNYA